MSIENIFHSEIMKVANTSITKLNSLLSKNGYEGNYIKQRSEETGRSNYSISTVITDNTSMMEFNENLIEDLNEFLGSRQLLDNLKVNLIALKGPMESTIYRGMPFPIHLLKVGNVLEEWNESTHWSKDFRIAEQFSKDDINEYYSKELGNDKYLIKKYNVKNADDLFVRTIFRMKNPTQAIDTHSLVKRFNLVDWLREKEVTFIGTNFKMISIKLMNDMEKPYYLVDAEEIKI